MSKARSASPAARVPAAVETTGVVSQEAFRRLVDTVQDYAIFMLTPTGHVATWNTGAQRIKGYAAAEIVGRHFSTFYPPDAVRSGWPDEELTQAASLGRFEDEGWRVRKDGSRFWANVVITALRAPNGDVTGFSKVTRDLTERRLHEERLRQSEENLRLLIEGVNDHALFMLDLEGFVVSWNAGAVRMFGFDAGDIVGRSAELLVSAESASAGGLHRLLRTARRTGHADDTAWHVRRGGARFWAEMTLTLVHDAANQPRGFAAITRDLSERRRAQELEIEGKRLNEFIAMLAHELRNPLAPIANAVAVLSKIAPTAQLDWCAKIIDRQVTHLSRLVDDLLDVSRITSGRIQLRKESIDLGTLVRSAAESVRPVTDQFGHQLTVKLPAGAVMVDGDATRLTQVVVNLVTNAAKYTPDAGIIDVELETDGTTARLRVSDNGLGMTQELIDTAFDLFVQGDRSLDRREGGLGIGLTLVKRIVQLHGGEIRADSEGPGHGTRVTVSLPSTASAPAAVEGVDTPAVAVVKARRVLVVDDNVDAAVSMAELLRMEGHEVETAHDGDSALRLAIRDMPDAIVLDIGLPGMDGYAVARALRGQPRLAGVRLIAMTGYGRAEDKHAARAAGFDVHLVKPVSSDDVLRAIG